MSPVNVEIVAGGEELKTLQPKIVWTIHLQGPLFVGAVLS